VKENRTIYERASANETKEGDRKIKKDYMRK
jgi:hypothetical protein